jgi:hypothetical protein
MPLEWVELSLNYLSYTQKRMVAIHWNGLECKILQTRPIFNALKQHGFGNGLFGQTDIGALILHVET